MWLLEHLALKISKDFSKDFKMQQQILLFQLVFLIPVSNHNIKYLHLFKKLSMFLFFRKAGKSKSYTKASNPSWRKTIKAKLNVWENTLSASQRDEIKMAVLIDFPYKQNYSHLLNDSISYCTSLKDKQNSCYSSSNGQGWNLIFVHLKTNTLVQITHLH